MPQCERFRHTHTCTCATQSPGLRVDRMNRRWPRKNVEGTHGGRGGTHEADLAFRLSAARGSPFANALGTTSARINVRLGVSQTFTRWARPTRARRLSIRARSRENRDSDIGGRHNAVPRGSHARSDIGTHADAAASLSRAVTWWYYM